MTNTQVISNLWQEMRQAINQAYATSKGNDDLSALRDYAEDISWSDDLQRLLETETANERQHRGTRSIVGFSSGTASKLILMSQVASGSKMTNLPSAIEYLQIRHTAFEAQVIGFLIRAKVNADWIKAVESFDYAKLMECAA